MRIAVCGGAKCGKTTLVNELANQLDLPAIQEYASRDFRFGPQITPANCVQQLTEILESKSVLENQATNGFVSDRSPIDLAVFWLLLKLPNRFPHEARQFFCACKSQLQHYNAVIFPPEPAPETGNANFFGKPEMIWERRANHSLIVGLAAQWLPAEKLLLIPPTNQTPEQRVTWVLESLQR